MTIMLQTHQVWSMRAIILFVLVLLSSPAHAVDVAFKDCLTPLKGKPYFVPHKVEAGFINPKGSGDNIIKYEVFGSVNGGRLTDLDASTNKYTTLKIESHVLQYEVYDDYQRFCRQAADGCPFGPGESSFFFEFNVSSAYQGVTFDTNFYIIDPTVDSDVIGCISVSVSPVLAGYVWYVLLVGFLAVFILLCISYTFAVYSNPWTGTRNIYLSTSNFGSDPNAIRLITPGIIDLLKYLQFAFFTACLSLNFPGFFQPVVSTMSWSALLFGINFVSDTPDSVEDDLYVVRTSKFGLGKMARTLTLSEDQDIWPAFMVWLLVVTTVIVILCLVGFGLAWTWRKIRRDNLDLRTRSLPFLGGVTLRIFLLAFGWPILAFSFFELLIIQRGPTSTAADVFAAVLMLAWVAAAGWTSYKITTTNREELYDDLSTVLLYGPLYNTYMESKANFVIIDLAITLIRGLTVGAIQDSGLAQITLLATTELSYLIALACIRPFNPITNMNFISVTMASIRLILIFLLIPFVGSLEINPMVRGWIAYVVLIIHALVLIMCVIHVIQVVLELFALMSGAVDTTHVPATSPTAAVYGMKMLSKRKQKDGAVLTKSGTRSSPDALLWNQQPAGRNDINADDLYVSSPTSETMPMTRAGGGDTYYRRPRRRQSSHDWAYGIPRSSEEHSRLVEEGGGEDEEDFTFMTDNKNQKNVNYAVREADVYYTQRLSDDENNDENENRNPLIQDRDDKTYDDDDNTNSIKKSIAKRLKMGFKKFQSGTLEEPEHKGFEVVRRPPIKRFDGKNNNENDENRDENANRETPSTSQSNNDEFDFNEEGFTTVSLHDENKN